MESSTLPWAVHARRADGKFVNRINRKSFHEYPEQRWGKPRKRKTRRR